MIRGDDYVSVGSKSELKWLQSEIEAAFEIKTDVLGLNDSEPPRGVHVVTGGKPDENKLH